MSMIETLDPIVGTTHADFMNGMPGIYAGIPFEDYTACDAVNSSKLKELARSAQHLKYTIDAGSKDTPQLQLGRIIHTRVLEPDLFEQTYVIEPKVDKRTTVGKEAHAAFLLENAGKICISQDDRTIAEGIYDNIMNHPDGRKIFELDGQNELSVITMDPVTGMRRKIRIDRHMMWDGALTLFDIKSTRDASPAGFPNEIRKYLYHLQGAYYLDNAAVAHEITHDQFIIIAGETKPPFAVGIYKIDQPSIDKGHSLWRKYLKQYQECVQTNVWPGYTTSIQELGLPGWATFIDEEEEDDE